MSNTTEWVIGAAPECDLVVDQPTVSGRHCRLRRTGDGWLLEDLGSTNGTFVNDCRLTQPVAVTRQDRITMGKSVLVPWPEDENASTKPAMRLPTGSGIGLKSVVGVAAALLVAIIAAVIWGGGSGVSDPEPDPTKEKKTPIAQKPRPERALYVLLVSDREQAFTFRIGTAFAISPHHLVTTAEAIKMMEQLREKYPKAMVYRPGDDKKQFTIDLQKARVHRQYQERYRKEQKVKHRIFRLAQEVEQLKARIDRLATPAGKKAAKEGAAPKNDGTAGAGQLGEEFAKKRKELAKDENEWFTLKDEQRYFDVGVIEVAETLDEQLPVAEATGKLFANTKLFVFGVPFPSSRFDTTPDDRLIPRRMESHIRQLPQLRGAGADITHVLLRSDSILLPADEDGGDGMPEFQWWIGSAVLNDRGEVIGVYSRLTPAVKPNQPPSGKLHDVALIARLRDFAPDLFPDKSKR